MWGSLNNNGLTNMVFFNSYGYSKRSNKIWNKDEFILNLMFIFF